MGNGDGFIWIYIIRKTIIKIFNELYEIREKFMREGSKCEKMIKLKKIFMKLILLISIIILFRLIYVILFKPLKISKNNIIENYLTIINILVTTGLSYSLLKTSKYSNKLSIEIAERENNRDEEKIRESSLIVYYDILSKINIIMDLYNKKEFGVNKGIVNNINNNSDWVKHIANLRDILTEYELSLVFDLYNNFILISDLQHSQGDKGDEINNIINILVEKVFNKPLIDYLWMDFEGITESLLNRRYFDILTKILLFVKKDKKDNRINSNKRIDSACECDEYGNIISGIDEYYINEEILLYKFEYEEGKLIKGKLNDKKNNLVFDCLFDEDGCQKDGYVTRYGNDNDIEYKGDIKDGKYSGKGILYYSYKLNKIEFEGIWECNKKVRGEYNGKGTNAAIKYFKGEYKDDEPYTGKIKCGFDYKIAEDVYGFKGEILNGVPVDGTGYRFNKHEFSDEYKFNHPECEGNEYSQNYEDYYYKEPSDEEIEYLGRKSEEASIECEKSEILDNTGHAIELLEANWENGQCKLLEDEIINKAYLSCNW